MKETRGLALLPPGNSIVPPSAVAPLPVKPKSNIATEPVEVLVPTSTGPRTIVFLQPSELLPAVADGEKVDQAQAGRSAKPVVVCGEAVLACVAEKGRKGGEVRADVVAEFKVEAEDDKGWTVVRRRRRKGTVKDLVPDRGEGRGGARMMVKRGAAEGEEQKEKGKGKEEPQEKEKEKGEKKNKNGEKAKQAASTPPPVFKVPLPPPPPAHKGKSGKNGRKKRRGGERFELFNQPGYEIGSGEAEREEGVARATCDNQAGNNTKLDVTVVEPSRYKYIIPIPRTATVAALKEVVAKHVNLLPNRFDLLLDGRTLNDSQALISGFGIEGGQIVYLNRCLRGGGPNPKQDKGKGKQKTASRTPSPAPTTPPSPPSGPASCLSSLLKTAAAEICKAGDGAEEALWELAVTVGAEDNGASGEEVLEEARRMGSHLIGLAHLVYEDAALVCLLEAAAEAGTAHHKAGRYRITPPTLLVSFLPRLASLVGCSVTCIPGNGPEWYIGGYPADVYSSLSLLELLRLASDTVALEKVKVVDPSVEQPPHDPVVIESTAQYLIRTWEKEKERRRRKEDAAVPNRGGWLQVDAYRLQSGAVALPVSISARPMGDPVRFSFFKPFAAPPASSSSTSAKRDCPAFSSISEAASTGVEGPFWIVQPGGKSSQLLNVAEPADAASPASRFGVSTALRIQSDVDPEGGSFYAAHICQMNQHTDCGLFMIYKTTPKYMLMTYASDLLLEWSRCRLINPSFSYVHFVVAESKASKVLPTLLIANKYHHDAIRAYLAKVNATPPSHYSSVPFFTASIVAKAGSNFIPHHWKACIYSDYQINRVAVADGSANPSIAGEAVSAAGGGKHVRGTVSTETQLRMVLPLSTATAKDILDSLGRVFELMRRAGVFIPPSDFGAVSPEVQAAKQLQYDTGTLQKRKTTTQTEDELRHELEAERPADGTRVGVFCNGCAKIIIANVHRNCIWHTSPGCARYKAGAKMFLGNSVYVVPASVISEVGELNILQQAMASLIYTFDSPLAALSTVLLPSTASLPPSTSYNPIVCWYNKWVKEDLVGDEAVHASLAAFQAAHPDHWFSSHLAILLRGRTTLYGMLSHVLGPWIVRGAERVIGTNGLVVIARQASALHKHVVRREGPPTRADLADPPVSDALQAALLDLRERGTVEQSRTETRLQEKTEGPSEDLSGPGSSDEEDSGDEP
ncbi:hypothetical protein JCM8097_000543 [Rhodosporidiobolus ruineniae]